MGYSAGDGSGQSFWFVCGHVVCFTGPPGESPGIDSGDEADCMFGMHMVYIGHAGTQF